MKRKRNTHGGNDMIEAMKVLCQKLLADNLLKRSSRIPGKTVLVRSLSKNDNLRNRQDLAHRSSSGISKDNGHRKESTFNTGNGAGRNFNDGLGNKSDGEQNHNDVGNYKNGDDKSYGVKSRRGYRGENQSSIVKYMKTFEKYVKHLIPVRKPEKRKSKCKIIVPICTTQSIYYQRTKGTSS